MGLLDAFGLLYPAALYLFAIPPLLVIAYFARERPRQAVVSSVIAFRALRAIEGERFGRKPRLRWTFFVELLMLCLAVLAIASPYVLRKSDQAAVVIDNSAAMQALTKSGKSRFAEVRERIAPMLGSNHAEIVLYATSPEPYQVGVFRGADAFRSALERVPVTDAPSDTSLVADLLAEVCASRNLQKIIFATYRPVALPLPANLQLIIAAAPIANYAIGSFVLSRESFGAAVLHGRVTVANFSSSAQTLTVAVSADGNPAGRTSAFVEAGHVSTLDFPNLVPAKVYTARLERSDGFPLDNLAYAIGSGVPGLSILFVSPTPNDGASLRSIPGVRLTTVAPAAYSPADLRNIDLAIFEYAVPKALPTVNSLLIMPPSSDPVFNFSARSAPRLDLTGWPPIDPLTDGVNFHLLNLGSGQYLEPHAWMRPVVEGSGGALMMAGTRQGHHFLATGFNPLPYLGRANLPMSILTLNMLGQLAGFGGQATAFKTGEPWIIPSGVKRVVFPSGRSAAVHPGERFSSTAMHGLYTLIGADGGSTVRAVNLADLETSDLENSPPITIRAASAALTQETVIKNSLTPYLVVAIMLLLIIESLLVYLERRPVMPLANR